MHHKRKVCQQQISIYTGIKGLKVTIFVFRLGDSSVCFNTETYCI